MKKYIPIVGMCLLAACLLAGCKSKNTPVQSTTAPVATTTTTTISTDNLPAEGVLSCQKDGTTIAIRVTLAECANEEVSLLVLSDLSYQYTWWENPDACLSDLGQLTLDAKGEGSIELKLKSSEQPVYLLLTTSAGVATLEVK